MITLEEQIQEARRELALRKTTFPAWVKAGTLDASTARYRILAMQEIVRTLSRLDAESRQLGLFEHAREA